MSSNETKKTVSLRKLLLFFCLSATLVFAPVFPCPTAQAFSVGDEKKIGEELLSIVRKSFNILDDPDISQYINQVGDEILQVTGVQFFDYHFFVINNPEFNAFAAPSGLIFMHSGLIEEMGSEAEFISVLAHEVGHVTSRHIADRIKKMTKTSIATAALAIAGIAIGGGALSEALITGSMAAGSSLNLKFSRQDEEEADRLAYGWMKNMGIDPSPMTSMLSKMHKISVYRMANIPPYLLTHPEPRRRLGYVQDLLFMDDEAKNLAKRDNFNFLRIRQRIISLTKKSAVLSQSSLRTLSEEKSKEPEKAMARFGLYLAYLNEANFAKAEEELLQVITAYPNEPVLLADQAMIFFKEGKYDKALPIFLKAQERNQSCAFTSFYLARTWQEKGENDKALKIFNDLLVKDPDYSRLHYHIGQIKTKQNKKGEGHYHLGIYFWYEGDPDMARFHLDQAISDSESPDSIKEKASSFKKKIEEIEKG